VTLIDILQKITFNF